MMFFSVCRFYESVQSMFTYVWPVKCSRHNGKSIFIHLLLVTPHQLFNFKFLKVTFKPVYSTKIQNMFIVTFEILRIFLGCIFCSMFCNDTTIL